MSADRPAIDLRLALDTSDLDDLERILLRARAAELSEVRRRNVRLTAGYGDPTNRAAMDDDARSAQRRYDLLGRVLAAIASARQET
ncbi:MAG: hypothetical protein ACSLFN_01565 [Candidatus Limnocylindrales bacterium]